MKIHKNWLILLHVILIFLVGCSGMSYAPNDPTKWQAKYHSNPDGAEIYVDGQYVGIAPIAYNYPSLGVSSKKVIAKFPPGSEQIVTSCHYTFEILFDFINNKAKITEYPTALSLFARTREVAFEKNNPKSLIDAIIQNDMLAVSKLIKDSSEVNGKSQNGITPLLVAVELNNLEAVKMLLESGAFPNTQSPDGRFPLSEATVKQNEKFVKILLDNGADPNMTNKHGVSPLMFAAARTNISILNVLIDNGAKINQKSGLGQTPLMAAVLGNNVDMVKELVSKGADINIVETQHGTTPLLQSACQKHYEIAEYLMRSGADRDIPDYKGITLRQHALNTNDNKLLEIASFNTEIITLEKIETEFNNECKKYQERREHYSKAKNEFNKKEVDFLNRLSNKQLELYSDYTENIISNKANLARVLLSFRKFSDSLYMEKKDEFVRLYSEKQKNESDSDLLDKMYRNLIERKKIIANLKEGIAKAEKKAMAEEQQVRELALRNQQQMLSVQNAQAAQATQNTVGMLSILATCLNSYNAIQTQKYNAQAAAYRRYSEQYESDRRNRQLINSIKGVETAIRSAY